MPAGLAFLNVKSWHPATYVRTYVSVVVVDGIMRPSGNNNGSSHSSTTMRSRSCTSSSTTTFGARLLPPNRSITTPQYTKYKQENQKKIWIAEKKAEEKEKREKDAAAQLAKEMEA
jgi:hypothetical protein